MTDTRGGTASSTVVAVAVVAFCISGCSGLIYQSIWSHYLGLYLGHAAYAQCLVLAIFMGGLGLGSWLASRYGGRGRNLLLLYAAVEAAIGLFGLSFHPFFIAATTFAYDTVLPGMSSDIAISLLKWLSGALLILPQSILLGTTFPLMANGIIRRAPALPGSVISVLYFSNSLGAAAGALVATFVLLPSIGLPGAMAVAGALNLLVALIAWGLSRTPGILNPVPEVQAVTNAIPVPSHGTRLLLGAAFITGATSFVYEIGWVRMLSLVFGTTLHSFELMLAAFIGGLALGGWVLRGRIDRIGDLIRAGAWAQIAMGLAALATLMLYGKSFEWTAYFMHALAHTAEGYVLFNLATASVAVLIMVPAAFFAGMTLPIFSLALSRSGAGEAAIGRIYSANTFGAIVGVIVTVLWLLPVLGLKLAMTLAALGDIALGLVLFRRSTRGDGRLYIGVLAASGLLAVAFTKFAPFDQRELASGVYRSGVARMPDDARILFYRDGVTASVDVGEQRGVRRIGTNGKSDSAITVLESEPPTSDENTMVLAAVLPLATNPQARTAAVIGIGTGMSSNTLLGAPTLQVVDTIEIEPAMVSGARMFGNFSRRVFEDPRSHIHIEDARVFFSAHPAPYDIIISEPSNPWVTGTASLFTDEFYAHVTRHLAPGGVFVQWIQLYEIDDELVGTVTNALGRRFRDYRLYLSNDSDLLVVASADRDLAPLDPAILSLDAIKASLAHVNMRSPADVGMHDAGSKRDLEPYLREYSGRLNSDYNQVLSLDAPRARFAAKSAIAVHRLIESDLPLIEMTQRRAPPAPDASISIDANYGPSQDVAAAHETLARWTAAPAATSFIDAQAASAISALREYRRSCGKSADVTAAIEWMYQVAAATIPHLSPQELSAIWGSGGLRGCVDAPERAVAMEDVLVALAARDAAETLRRAQSLLDKSEAELSPQVADYLLRAMMTAAIAADKPDQVAKITQAYATRIESPQQRVQERLYLQSVAAARAHAAAGVVAGRQ